MATNLPSKNIDVLLHQKSEDGTEFALYPITRYSNILSSPAIVTDRDTHPGAPFHLLVNDEVEITDSEEAELLNVNL